jgi:hypothetical protein
VLFAFEVRDLKVSNVAFVVVFGASYIMLFIVVTNTTAIVVAS